MGTRITGSAEAEERKAVQALIDAVNTSPATDPRRKQLKRFAEAGSAVAVRALVGVLLPTIQSTATGALSFRQELRRDGFGRYVQTNVLDAADLAPAGPGVFTYAFQLLADESKSHRAHLGQCKACGKFFLAKLRVTPGPKGTAYCGDKCAGESDRKGNAARVRLHRERKRQELKKGSKK
jgi:hypothetical protein